MTLSDWEKALKILCQDPKASLARFQVENYLIFGLLSPVLSLLTFTVQRKKAHWIVKVAILLQSVAFTATLLYFEPHSLELCLDRMFYPASLSTVSMWAASPWAEKPALPVEASKKLWAIMKLIVLCIGLGLALWGIWFALFPVIVNYFETRPYLMWVFGAACAVLYVPLCTAAYAIPESLQNCVFSEKLLKTVAPVFTVAAPLFIWVARYVDTGLLQLSPPAKHALLVAAPMYACLPMIMERVLPKKAIMLGELDCGNAGDAENQLAISSEK